MSDSWIPKHLTTPKEQLVYAIIDFLKQESTNNEDLSVAVQLLQTSYKMEVKDDAPKGNLLQIFEEGKKALEKTQVLKYNVPEIQVKSTEEKLKNFMEILKQKGYFSKCEEGTPEYEERYAKAKQKFDERQKANAREADKLKEEGNELLRKGLNREAIDKYIRAIELNPTNAIYYANMAAAYTNLEDHTNAIKACEKAIKLDPNYTKGYSRLGNTYYNLGNLEKALELYTIASQKDPNNQTYKTNIEKLKQKIEEKKKSSPFGFGQSMPDLSQMDLGKLSDMFNNPEFMNIATNMMQQPQFQQMMGNLMQNMGGGIPQQIPEESMREIENDPDYQKSKHLQDVFKEVKEKGPAALLNYLADAEVQTFLVKFAQKKMSSLGSNNPFAQFMQQFKKDKDDPSSSGIV